jgi:ketosteroid isomerase-like protein
MKDYLMTFVLFFACYSGYTQDAQIESTIRNLEQRECKATLEKDTATLRKLWADDFTVNAPVNRVITAGRNTLDRPVITQANYLSFTREVEHVILKGDLAISMGNEVVVNKGTDAKPGSTIKRRHTNIWMKSGETWKLIARHANVICQ